MKNTIVLMLVVFFIVYSECKEKVPLIDNYCVGCKDHKALQEKLESLKRTATSLSKRYKEIDRQIRDLEECDCVPK